MKRVRIAHLSDPHFGTINASVFEGLLTTLHKLQPTLILLTGDITQRARRSQFRAAKDFVKSLGPTPLIALPGNHDIPLYNLPARLLHPYRGFRRIFKGKVEKDYLHYDVRVTGLNSTSRWRAVQGDFNLQRITRRIEAPSKPAIVRIVAFHHPMDCAQHVDDKNLLRQRDSAMALFAKEKVDLILGGHIHDPHVALSPVRYPQVQRSIVIGVAGTCLSWRTRSGAPNSFNFIEVDTEAAPQIDFTRYDVSDNLLFAPIETKRFIRTSEQGWESR